MNSPTERRPARFQFSILTLLLLTTNCGILFALGQISNHPSDGCMRFVKAYGALGTVYIWRIFIMRFDESKRRKRICLLVVFAALLPYIYCFIGSMFIEPHGSPESKWLGSPIWLFAVPTLSFLFFDLDSKWCSTTAFTIRSLIEMVLVFPVWTFIWVWTQLLFNWGWI